MRALVLPKRMLPLLSIVVVDVPPKYATPEEICVVEALPWNFWRPVQMFAFERLSAMVLPVNEMDGSMVAFPAVPLPLVVTRALVLPASTRLVVVAFVVV